MTVRRLNHAVLYVRVIGALAALNLAVCTASVPYLIGPGLVAVAIAAVGAWRRVFPAPGGPWTGKTL